MLRESDSLIGDLNRVLDFVVKITTHLYGQVYSLSKSGLLDWGSLAHQLV